MKIKNLQSQLAYYARKAANNKLALGSSGNLSVRRGNGMYIKATNKTFQDSRPSDFVYLDLENPKLGSAHRRNSPSCEYRLHIACYQKRPDAKAVFHTHPVFATALYSAGVRHKAITMEFALYIKKPIPIVDFMPPGSLKLAQAVARASLKNDVILIKQHGLVTLGKTLHEAYLKALIVEREQKAAVICKIMRKAPAYLSRAQIDGLSKA
jgi:L-fuculose-phosphate aldolase